MKEKYIILSKDGKIYVKGECVGSWTKNENGEFHAIFMTPKGIYSNFLTNTISELRRVVKGRYMNFYK